MFSNATISSFFRNDIPFTPTITPFIFLGITVLPFMTYFMDALFQKINPHHTLFFKISVLNDGSLMTTLYDPKSKKKISTRDRKYIRDFLSPIFAQSKTVYFVTFSNRNQIFLMRTILRRYLDAYSPEIRFMNLKHITKFNQFEDCLDSMGLSSEDTSQVRLYSKIYDAFVSDPDDTYNALYA